MRSRSYSIFASLAMASVCSTVLVEPPMAMSRARALSIDLTLMISSGLMSFFTSSTICLPAALYRSCRRGSTAKIVPLPGRAMPIASDRQFMELAVNMPEQLPCVGQPAHSSSLSSSSLILPALNWATPSKILIRSTVLPSLVLPAFIGPPETNRVGTLSLTAPMNIPGMILSQFGMQIKPSKQWARTIVSTESATISREASEYFMPVWPIATPSQTAIVLNSNGTPPAWRMASFTTRATSLRWTWPGTTSQKLLATPMNGLSMSTSFKPHARSRPRWGAR